MILVEIQHLKGTHVKDAWRNSLKKIVKEQEFSDMGETNNLCARDEGGKENKSLGQTYHKVITYFPMESGRAISWLTSTLRRVRLVSLPRSAGSSWRQFSERWRSERDANFANPSGRSSSLFLVTSSTARLKSLTVDW